MNASKNHEEIKNIVISPQNGADYESNLATLKALHHSQCLFNRNPPVPNLCFRFDNGGRLLGEFSCGRYHQGYDAMTHGGVVAAIIDAAMVQCLMGHGIVGYTTDLSIRYRKPVMILQPTLVEAWIAGIRVGCLYSMKCEVFQNGKVAVRATATFYKTKSNNMRT